MSDKTVYRPRFWHGLHV